MRTYWIAAIPGDGIGKEVLPLGIEALKAVANRERDFALLFDVLPWGADHYRTTDCFAPAGGLDKLRRYDAIYFGAFGDATIPDHVVRWGWWLPVCRALAHYATIGPIRILPGLRGPLQDCGARDIDWLLVRDNAEQHSLSGSGRVRRVGGGLEDPAFIRAFHMMRLALELARSRTRRNITIVTGGRTEAADRIWDRASAATRHEFPGVVLDFEPIDTMTSRMVQRPRTLDTIVAIGPLADVVADLAMSLAGGSNLLPKCNLDPSRSSPPLFRPAHGPIFEIAGKGTANPIAALWSGALMLEHLGERPTATRLLAAIERITSAGAPLPPDLGGIATTREVAEAVLAAVTDT